MPVKLSVIMPVFNSEHWLKEAIDSVLSQTFTDFELLIYDDGSSDSSPEIIKGYRDPRIKLHSLERNRGLIYCLNLGLKDASGEYIARMDADDICKSQRFEKQISFLETNTETGICGTQISIIGSDYRHRRPCSDDELRWWIFRGSPFAHPSIMMRADLIRNNALCYSSSAYVAEDFDLWWRLAFHCKLANLNEILLDYRVHNAQESSAKSDAQLANHRVSLNGFIKAIGIDPVSFESSWINGMLSGDNISSPAQLIKTHSFFNALKNSEKAIRFFGIDSIDKHMKEREIFYVKNLNSYSLKLLYWCLNKGSWQIMKDSGINPYVFIIKSLLNWKTRN